MGETLLLVLVLGGFSYGLHRFVKGAAARTLSCCADAARVLSLPAVSLSREEAEQIFLAPERRVLSDVVAFTGELGGAKLMLGAFTHESNTALNGVLIPITATHVIARLPRPLSSGRIEICRRVYGAPASEVELGEPLDSACVVRCEQPEPLRVLLREDEALARKIVDFLEAGQGCAFVHADRVRTFVAHRDAAKIRAAARAAVELARALSRAVDSRAPLRG